MRHTLIILTLSLLLAAPVAATDFAGYDVLVPIAARTPGLYGSDWRTDLYVTNTDRRTSAEPVRVSIVFTPANGVDQIRGVDIAPRGTVILKDVLRTTFGQQQAVGIIRVVAERPEARVAVRARVYNVGSAQGEFGQTIPGMPVTKLSRDTYLPGLSGVDGNRTNVGIANPAGVEALITVALYEQSGEGRGAFSTVVAPRSVLLLNNIFSYFGAGLLDGAMVQVTSSHGVYAYASVVRSDSGDGDFVTGTGVQIDDSGLIVTPSCAHPAPLRLAPTPADGYIVLFQPGTDAATVTATLSARYGFTPKNIYEHSMRAFHAELTPAIVAALRCEPVVHTVEQNGLWPIP